MTLYNSKKVEIEQIRDAHELTPSLWVEGMVNESGKRIEFKDHRFLIDIYNDLSPYQVILKPPQIGATVMNVIKALWVASHMKKQIIYTMPTMADMYEMVSSGFNRIIAQNRELKELTNKDDTMEHKTVGDGLIRFRGTFSSKQAMMVPSNLNIHDEVDSSDEAVIEQYETRLQSQSDGWRWYFSHPSLVGRGVSKYWEQSDKKEWFVTCPICKEEQVLEWPRNVQDDGYICHKCKHVLSQDDIRYGEWKPTASGEFSGYHISQMMCPWIKSEKIQKDYEEKSAQYFYNFTLGLPYADSTDVVTKDQILQNVRDIFNTQEDRVIIGVDTGLPIWYTLMNRQGVFHYGKCGTKGDNYDPYKQLESFLLRWPKSIIVSDQGGDLIGIRNLQERYPGRVFLAYYRKDQKSQKLIKWGEGSEFGKVVIDRNRMMTFMLEQLKEGNRVTFNGTRNEWMEFADHFTHLLREVRDTPTGPVYVWTRNGPDHLVHSLLYALVGYDRFGQLPQIETNPIVGSFPVAIGSSIRANDLVRLLNRRNML